MFLYNLVLLVHVLSAIFALGPGLVLKFVFKNAKTITDLKNAQQIRGQVLKIIMVCGASLFLTGLILGFMNTALFKMGWYHASLTLFLIATAIGPIFLAKKVKKIKAILQNATSEEIPVEYYELSKNVGMFINIQNSIYMLVLVLMVLKPF